MKRVVSALLAMVMLCAMLVSFTGCGADDPIVGTWQATIDMTDYINSQIGDEEMQNYIKIKDFSLLYRLVFDADGTYMAVVNEDEAEKMYAAAKDTFKTGATQYLQSMIDAAGGGYTVDELLALSGTSLDKMVEQAFSDDNLDTMIDSMTKDGNFKAEDGKLWLSAGLDYAVDPESYERFEISGNKLTLNEGTAETVEIEGFEIYPLVFEKVE